MKYLFLAFLLSVTTVATFSQNISEDEKKLYQSIMAYRQSKGLPTISYSKALSVVAQTHVYDLVTNKPEKGNCNMHSWSSNGRWTACCYIGDTASAERMWMKPRELTNYKGNGYEIAYWHSTAATPNAALESWKTSSGHNGLLVNKGIWKASKWQAIGIGIYKNYAVVWFGEEADKE